MALIIIHYYLVAPSPFVSDITNKGTSNQCESNEECLISPNELFLSLFIYRKTNMQTLLTENGYNIWSIWYELSSGVESK